MLALKLSAAAVTTTLAEIFKLNLGGTGPVRLTIKNTGTQALSIGKVQHVSDDAGTPIDLDTATFGILAAGAIAQLVVAEPVEVLRMQAQVAAATTTLEITVNTPSKT